MPSPSKLGPVLVLLLACAVSGAAFGLDAAAGWQRILVEPASENDPEGTPRPGCSGGPLVSTTAEGTTVAPAPTDFSFFLRPGDPKRLLIVWDGGGACWDSITCIDSAMTGSPVYDLGIDETPESLSTLGGIADTQDARNPVREFTLVFIPYCTGDLYFGSRDVLYDAPGGGQWLIHHRGQDNVLAVLDILKDYYADTLGSQPEEIVLTGASAGGYGVLYSFPAVTQAFPLARKVSVLGDSANGVINWDLYLRALTPEGVWGAWTHLPPELEETFASGPDTLVMGMYQALGWRYPAVHFGQYSRALDGVQILFYNLAKHLNAPEHWLDPAALFISGLEWSTQTRSTLSMTALTTWNYRFYLGEGTGHTIIGDQSFYEERSAGDVQFSDWFADMIEKRWPFRGQWQNSSCAPDCLPAL
ncbi:pectin acetylesterase-family hydrolase [Thiocystis violacea]|uniref:pectin acetylesterase-family hydrolase n=1 Tax=Thiocystis violacea TaxID=13725 RepID=UPI00190527ED|nr:pectin acetylesterase-family hydrolase [Thiocystis violacea]MBK1716833.1 hypothetical protein [Thiocystis violacea]